MALNIVRYELQPCTEAYRVNCGPFSPGNVMDATGPLGALREGEGKDTTEPELNLFREMNDDEMNLESV